METNALRVLILTIVLNLIPLFIKIYNNKLETGFINFINGTTMGIMWIFAISYLKNYKYPYLILLYLLTVFQLVFLYNAYVIPK
jgi:hypothetical protein